MPAACFFSHDPWLSCRLFVHCEMCLLKATMEILYLIIKLEILFEASSHKHCEQFVSFLRSFYYFDLTYIVSVAAVKDVDRYHEKITVSLYSSALPPNLSSITLGVITSDDLPLHYK